MVIEAEKRALKCDKCGGYLHDDYQEKRSVCLNCGAEKYYGVPDNTAQILPSTWEFWFVPQQKKYRSEWPGALVSLGGGTAHYIDTGCEKARRCQDCPCQSCVNPDVIGGL